MGQKISQFALSAMFFVLSVPVMAQQAKETKIAVIGAPRSPRFFEIVAGLKKGLGGLGYAAPSLVLREIKIARAEEKDAKSVVEGLLRKTGLGVDLALGSSSLSERPLVEVPVVFITPGDPVHAGLVRKSRPSGRQHHRHDLRISRAFGQTS